MSQCNHKANLFSAIHNGILSKAVHIKYTTFRGSRRVLKYLYDGGHIQGYRLLDSGKFIIYLKVDNLNNEKAGVWRFTKRLAYNYYVGFSDLRRFHRRGYNGRDHLIVSTPQGYRSSKEALKAGMGGRLLYTIKQP